MSSILQVSILSTCYTSTGGGGGGLPAPGTLWTFGDNYAGQLGLGDIIDRTSPVQVAGSWSSIAGGNRHSLAKKNI